MATIIGDSSNEKLIGTIANDTITAMAGDDVLIGLAGADILNGGAGNNTASYEMALAAVTANLALPDNNLGDAQGDVYTSIENLQGSIFADVLVGDSIENTLSGDKGNDTLIGSDGNDVLNGDSGLDTVDYSYTDTPLSITLQNATAVTVSLSATDTDSLTSIENLIGGNGNDFFSADLTANVANSFSGGLGDDTLLGGAGNDILNGGAGVDSLDGGAGKDASSYATASEAVTADLSNSNNNMGEASGETYLSIENLIGSAFADALGGDANNNALYGGAGNDVLVGATGLDYLSGDDGDDFLYGDLQQSSTYTYSGHSYLLTQPDTWQNIQGLAVASGGNLVTVSDADEQAWLARTFPGNSWLGYTDQVTEGQFQWISGETTSYSNWYQGEPNNFAGAENYAYMASDGVNNTWNDYQGDAIFAGIIELNQIAPGTDTLLGGAGNDTLVGGIQADILNGGDGSDTACYLNANDGVTVDLLMPKNNTGDAMGDSFISIENLAGGNFADTLIGNTKNNTLQGSSGDDILIGNAGADALYGDDGIDTASYVTATKGVKVDLSMHKTNSGDAAGDKYFSIENVLGSDYQDMLSGDDNNNVLDGSLGADTLIGGKGNDTYSVDNVGDVVIEANRGGTDLINASVNYTLGNFQDNLTLTGISAINGSGNSLVNLIIGNSAANILNGMGGNDNLTGGNGKDIFQFTTASNLNTITDFIPVDDTFQLDNAIFPMLGIEGKLTAGFFKTVTDLTAPIDNNDYLLYDSSTGTLYYDADAKASNVAVPIALIGSGLTLTAADFVVI